MDLSALYLSPNVAENLNVGISHQDRHPNIPRTLQVPHLMLDVHQIRICSADEFDPVEHGAIQQTAYLSTVGKIFRLNKLYWPHQKMQLKTLSLYGPYSMRMHVNNFFLVLVSMFFT